MNRKEMQELVEWAAKTARGALRNACVEQPPSAADVSPLTIEILRAMREDSK